MKLLRPILLTIGVVFMLGAMAVGLALIPSVQRWAILRIAAKQPGLHLQLDGISAGFSGATFQDVALEHRGIKISFKRLTAEYSLWAFFSDHRLYLQQLNVRGLLIDASRLSSQKAQAGLAGGPAAMPGTLARMKLPWAFTLDKLDVQGRALLAGATGPDELQGEFQLQGGKIGPGHDGEIRLLGRVRNSVPDARVNTLDVKATLLVRESHERTFDHIRLTSLLEASGPGLAGKNQLKLAADMSRMATEEKDHITLDTVRAGQPESMLALNATYSPASADYTGEWSLSAGSAQLEPFLMGCTLPKFAATGSGRFEFFPSPVALSLHGSLQGDVSGFEKFRPELRALGTLRVKSDFDVRADSALIKIKSLSATVGSEHPLLDLRTTGPLDFNLKQRRLASAGATRGEILRVKLSELPMAWVAQCFPIAAISGGPITGEISVAQGEGDQFAFQTSIPFHADGIGVVKAGRTLLAKGDLKVDAEAEMSPARTQMKIRSLSLKSAAGDSMQAKLLLTAPAGLRLPLAMEGDFSADLPALLVPLLPTGPLNAKGFIDLNWLGDRIEVRRLEVESSDVNGNRLGSLTVPRPFVFDLTRGLAETQGPDEVPLANIKVGELPLFVLPRIYAGYSVSGRVGAAEASLSAQWKKLSLRATAPVSISDFSITQRKKPAIDRLKLLLQPTIEFNDGVFARLLTGAVRLQGGADISLAELNAEFTRGDSGMRVVSTFDLDLPAWSSQPFLLGRDALSSGQMKGEIRAAVAGDALQIEARATANNLIANENHQTLPVANLNLRADFDAAGHFSVRVPMLFDRAGLRSDLNFFAEGSVAPKGISFDAKLQSDHVELRDMFMLLAAAGSPLADGSVDSASAQERALSPPSPDQTAFWAGATGHVTVECKSVVNGQDWTMTGLNGRLLVQDDRLVLEKLGAAYDENSRFAAKGSLDFSPGLDPYRLTGDFSLSEFNAGRFFKTLHPDQAPVLEGFFGIRGTLEGQGLNFDDTIDRTFGTYDVTSRKGIFRGFTRDRRSIASKAVELVSSLLGDKSAEKIASGAFNIEQLAQELGELNFDQFTVKVSRDPSLNLKLENITLISPQIHFLGSGQLTYVAGKPLSEQPLEATLSLRAREKVEEILGKLKVLDGTRDELGYAKTKETLTLGGTLAKPDAMPFFDRLAASKQSDVAAPGNSGKPGE